jgi:hypothetical protein
VSLRELKGVLTPKALAALMHHFGGREIWIKQPPQDELIKVLGPRQAEKLSYFAGKGSLYIPLGRDWSELGRKVMELHRREKKVNEIASILHCSRRTVFRWLARPVQSVMIERPVHTVD